MVFLLISTIIITTHHPFWKGPFKDIFIISNDDGITLRPYFQTTQYSAAIYEPNSVEEIQDIVKYFGNGQNKTIRVVGSAYSSSPLFTNDILILLTHFDEIELNIIDILQPEQQQQGSTVTVGAGSLLQDVEDILYENGYVLPGFSSVQQQTMGGMLATSSYGVFGMINKYLTKVWMIDGNGNDLLLTNEHNSTWIAALKSNVGVLGVIYSMEFAIEKTFNVKHETVNVNVSIDEFTGNEFEDFLFPSNDNILGVKMTATSSSDFSIKTYYNSSENENIIHYTENTQLASFINSFLLPISCLIPQSSAYAFQLKNTDAVTDENKHVYTAKSSLMEIETFHGGFIYAIPFKNCYNAFLDLLPLLEDNVFSTANIIAIKQDNDYGLLSYAAKNDVCMFEIYPPLCSPDRLKLAQQFENNILLKYDGTVHWSKQLITINEIDNDNKINEMNTNFYGDNIDTFNNIRNVADPKGIFMNDYLRKLLNDEVDEGENIDYPLIDDYRRYSAAWNVIGWYSISISFGVSLIITICLLFSNDKLNQSLLLFENDNKKRFWYTLFGLIFVEILLAFIIHPITASILIL